MKTAISRYVNKICYIVRWEGKVKKHLSSWKLPLHVCYLGRQNQCEMTEQRPQVYTMWQPMANGIETPRHEPPFHRLKFNIESLFEL